MCGLSANAIPMADTSFNPALVQKSLGGLNYPASRDELVESARDNGAEDQVCEWLEALPEREYQSPADVMRALGEQETGYE